MFDLFREGGWGMYPTMLFGCLATLLLLRAKRPPSRSFWGAAAATVFSGLLGFSAGAIRTFQAISELPLEQQFSVMLIGVGESLSNIGLVLVFGVFLSLVFTIRALMIPGPTFAD